MKLTTIKERARQFARRCKGHWVTVGLSLAVLGYYGYFHVRYCLSSPCTHPAAWWLGLRPEAQAGWAAAFASAAVVLATRAAIAAALKVPLLEASIRRSEAEHVARKIAFAHQSRLAASMTVLQRQIGLIRSHLKKARKAASSEELVAALSASSLPVPQSVQDALSRAEVFQVPLVGALANFIALADAFNAHTAMYRGMIDRYGQTLINKMLRGDMPKVNVEEMIDTVDEHLDLVVSAMERLSTEAQKIFSDKAGAAEVPKEHKAP